MEQLPQRPRREHDHRIVDYGDLIAKVTAGFVGRRWVREAVDAFLAQAGPRAFLLLGEPGAARRLSWRTGRGERGYPHHFIGKGSLSGVALRCRLAQPRPLSPSPSATSSCGTTGAGSWTGSVGHRVDQRRQGSAGPAGGARGADLRLRRARRPSRPQRQPGGRALRGRPPRWWASTWKVVMDPEQYVRQLVTIPLTRIAARWPATAGRAGAGWPGRGRGLFEPGPSILALLPDGGRRPTCASSSPRDPAST